MKKAITIFFFSIYLLSTTEAHQLLKLPVVFLHFNEHRNYNKNITFLQFMEEHYMQGSPKDDDYDRDMQLPFKNTGDCVSAGTTAFVPLMVQYAISRPVAIVQKKRFISRDQLNISPLLSRVWQPPRHDRFTGGICNGSHRICA